MQYWPALTRNRGKGVDITTSLPQPVAAYTLGCWDTKLIMPCAHGGYGKHEYRS